MSCLAVLLYVEGGKMVFCGIISVCVMLFLTRLTIHIYLLAP